MKYCPTCQIQYTDDTLQFCFEDGTVLLDFYSRGKWQTPSEPLDETETVVRLNKMPPFWEQSQVTQVATLLPNAKKSNSPIILIAFVMCMLLASTMGIWFFLSGRSLKASGSSNTYSNNASRLTNISSNNTLRLPSPTPTLIRTPSNTNLAARTPNRNTDSGAIQTNSSPKRISVNGEALKACNHLLGSGLYGKWMQLGGEKGLLGCPVMSETEAPRSPKGTIGRMTQFSKGDGGYIIWHGSGRNSGTSFEVSGCMFKLYSSLGGTRSWLGFPVRDAYTTSTGARQDFEGGYILWDSKTFICRAYKTH